MKFSEVIKALEDGSKKKYEAIYMDKRYEISISEMGYFYCIAFETGTEKKLEVYTPVGGFNGNVGLNLDWNEIMKPVTWEKAIGAWANGYIIRLVMPEWEWIIHPTNEIQLTNRTMKIGKWFIEGVEAF